MSREVHLFVLQHGLWGCPADLHFVQQHLKRSLDPRKTVIINSNVNTARLTYDGIDMMGDRLARLVTTSCQRLLLRGTKVVAVSFVAYSLGGLICRYAIGR